MASALADAQGPYSALGVVADGPIHEDGGIRQGLLRGSGPEILVPVQMADADAVDRAVELALAGAATARRVATDARKAAAAPWADQISTSDGQIFRGTSTSASGSRLGVRTFPDGNEFAGQEVDDRRSGHGVFLFASGSRYEGEFRDDAFSGYGVYDFHNGERYMGEFHGGLRHGLGRFLFPDGRVLAGRFKADEFVEPL